MTREAVNLMVDNAVSTNTLTGLSDAALFRVMSDALLRIGEAVAIDSDHVTTEFHGSGRLLLHRSKADQEGKGAGLFLTARTVDAIQQLQQRAGYTEGCRSPLAGG